MNALENLEEPNEIMKTIIKNYHEDNKECDLTLITKKLISLNKKI